MTNKKDISFILPSNRNYHDYAGRVIKNINSLAFYGLTHEIVFVGPYKVLEDNVVNVHDDCESGGCVWGYNEGFKNSTGQYIFLCSDDHFFNERCVESLQFFNHTHFDNKKNKIFCLPTNNHGPCNLPDYSGMNAIIARYPVFERQTVEEQLQGYIYHPKFKHHYPDNWLGFWSAAVGEPIVELTKYDLTTFRNACIVTHDSYDETAFKELIESFNKGYKKYV